MQVLRKNNVYEKALYCQATNKVCLTVKSLLVAIDLPELPTLQAAAKMTSSLLPVSG
jgi:hypothetical protein